MRTRSPRIAPPVNGLVGSIASTATRSPARRSTRDEAVGERRLPGARRAGDPDDSRRSTSAPRRAARRARRGRPSPPDSTIESSRASAARSPLPVALDERRDVSRRRWSLFDGVVDHRGDARDAVHDDPLDAGLQRLHRDRAGAARARPGSRARRRRRRARRRRCRRRRSGAPGGSARSPRGPAARARRVRVRCRSACVTPNASSIADGHPGTTPFSIALDSRRRAPGRFRRSGRRRPRALAGSRRGRGSRGRRGTGRAPTVSPSAASPASTSAAPARTSSARTGAPERRGDAADDRVAALVAHVGAHAGELVDEVEPVVEHVLGDDRRCRRRWRAARRRAA